jgi:hypothetical protein
VLRQEARLLSRFANADALAVVTVVAKELESVRFLQCFLVVLTVSDSFKEAIVIDMIEGQKIRFI